jgi:hypothetical protein
VISKKQFRIYYKYSLGPTHSSDPIITKENSSSAFGLEITGVKPKKTVTINDPPVVCNK